MKNFLKGTINCIGSIIVILISPLLAVYWFFKDIVFPLDRPC